MKVILEKEDIEKLIKSKYNPTEIKGLPDKMEVEIKVDNVPQPEMPAQYKNVQPTPQPEPKPYVVKDGNIDANASGLTSQPRKRTVPGGAMGQERGRMKVF